MITLSFRVIADAIPREGQRVVSLRGDEALTQPYRYAMRLAFAAGAAVPEIDAAVLQAPCSLTFLEDGQEVRRVSGIICDAEWALTGEGTSGHGLTLGLTLAPRLWLLSEFTTTELFLDRTTPEILADRLAVIGLRPDEDFVLSLRATYPRREIVVQYEEDGLAFINRLCEHWGITYHFEQRGDRDVVIFTDHPSPFGRFDPDAPPVPLHAHGDPLGIIRQSSTLRRTPRQIAIKDYNYRTPHMAMAATASTTPDATEGEHFSYGDHAKSSAEATFLARVRAEAVACERLVVRGTSLKMRFQPGRTFVFEDPQAHETELLLTRVTHHAELAPGDSEPTYHNDYEAIRSTTPFRPERRTARPRIQGFVHGVIDGAVRGPYAEIDEAGRYKVHFRYDRSGRTDLTASHPVRLMQTHGGPDYGMHFPYRPGTEVLVGFVEGDPDRPIIVGAAPNPQMSSPVSRRNYTENVLRSQGRNEMVMEDLEGENRIRLATPHSNTVMQLGSIFEPESGALIRSDNNITSAAGRAITEASPIRMTLAVKDTALASSNLVHLAGLTDLGPVIGQGGQDHGKVDRRAGDVLGALSSLSAFPATSSPPAAPVPPTKTWSQLAGNLSTHAHRQAEDAVHRMTFRTRRLSATSKPRSGGQPLASGLGPHAILGSGSGSTVFARDELLLFADHIATLSSDEVTRVVGGQQVEIQSPEEIEIAARRVARLTSASLVDVQGAQIYLRGAESPAQAEDALPDDVSIAIVADHNLRLKSANGALVACAEEKLVLHSHDGSADLSARHDVNIAGGSIHETGGTVSIKSTNGNVAIKSVADISLAAEADVRIDALVNLDVHATSITVAADGAIIIRGGKITIEGATTIDGPLTVTGQINSQ